MREHRSRTENSTSLVSGNGISVRVGQNRHTKKDKEVWTTSGEGDLFSQLFKPITTAPRQVTMEGIA